MKEEMKQEDKELLLKDLCGRLPYGVKIQGVNPDGEVIVEELSTIGINGDGIFDCNMIELSNIKPYLFPMKNMTEEQILSIRDYFHSIEGRLLGFQGRSIYLLDSLNKLHIDYRGLIEKSLAIDATDLNIYKEETK